MGAHTGQGLELLLADRLGAHSNHDHEKRNQGGGAGQDGPGGPTDGKNHDQNADGDHDGQPQLGQVVGKKIVQGFHLFHDDAGQGTGLLRTGKGRPGSLHVLNQFKANVSTDPGPGLEPRNFASPGQCGAAYHDQSEKNKIARQRRPWDGFNKNSVNQVGDESGLGNEQQPAAKP